MYEHILSIYAVCMSMYGCAIVCVRGYTVSMSEYVWICTGIYVVCVGLRWYIGMVIRMSGYVCVYKYE